MKKLLPLTLCLLLAACGGKSAQEAAVPPAPTGTELPAADAAPAPAAAAAAAVTPAAASEGEAVDAGDVANAISPVATAVAANTPAPAAAVPGRWVMGRNYTVLVPAQPTDTSPDKVEAIEVFWYGCGHCFHLDPYLENWRKGSKPAFVNFQRVPVMWNDINRQHARLFYALEAMGKLEQLHTAVFREIHVNGNPLADQDPAKGEALQVAFLKARGITDAQIKQHYKSFQVNNKLQRAEVLTRRYQVTGVPLMVVNGKYTTDVGMAGGEQALLDLVTDLANGERRR